MQKNNWLSLSSLDEITNYRKKNLEAHLVVDTNVFLLYLVGNYDVEYLEECPLMTENSKNYGKSEYDLFVKILNIFLNKVVITPHILSEINMLVRTRIKPDDKMKNHFNNLLKLLESCKEENVSKEILVKNKAILNFGFTDMSLTELALMRQWVVLTDDLPLFIKFNQYLPIINFSSVVANDLKLNYQSRVLA